MIFGQGRVVCWFSCGATSAVAAKLAIAEHGHDNVVIAYTDPGSEHPDNVRFREDCAAWFDHEIVVLRSERYADTWQVWEERRFLNSPEGALCTVELKKKLRMAFEAPDDTQVFGYDASEAARADVFRRRNPEVDLWCPLIDRGLTHADCLAIIERAGITLPTMYQQGYEHNNCIGCPKGGMGYWNKIRVDYPVVFRRMAKLERDLDATCVREEIGPDSRATRPVFLDELDPNRGDYATEPKIECSLLCAIAEADMSAA